MVEREHAREIVFEPGPPFSRQVGVTLVRELYDALTAEGANEALLVTCGQYTEDAREFATGKPIRMAKRWWK